MPTTCQYARRALVLTISHLISLTSNLVVHAIDLLVYVDVDP